MAFHKLKNDQLSIKSKKFEHVGVVLVYLESCWIAK
jgi:hypothetical protein